MAYRFRSIRELAGDLQTLLEALVDGAAAPLFRDVAVFRATRYQDLAAVAEAQVRPPAALIVPGPAELPGDGVRHLRQLQFAVYILAEYDAAAPGALDVHDRADTVVAAFHPASAAATSALSVEQVAWEVLGHEPVDAGERGAAGVVRVRLRASDRLRDR